MNSFVHERSRSFTGDFNGLAAFVNKMNIVNAFFESFTNGATPGIPVQKAAWARAGCEKDIGGSVIRT